MSDVNADIDEESDSFVEPTEEEQKILEKFYEDNKSDLIESPSKCREEGLPKFLWDNWGELNEYFKDKTGQDLYLCTIVTDEGDTAWIVKGHRWINRVGYLVSRKPFIIENRDIRYW